MINEVFELGPSPSDLNILSLLWANTPIFDGLNDAFALCTPQVVLYNIPGAFRIAEVEVRTPE